MPKESYGLSEIEYNLMKYFWANSTPIPFADVLEYCNNVLKYDWAKTTLHTYLTRLIKKGILHSDRKGYKKSYYPEITEKELAHRYASSFVENNFGGSVPELFLSLTYNTKLSEEDITELKQILEENLNR